MDVNSDEDELENVNLSEFQKTSVAKERAKRKKMYDATDEGQVMFTHVCSKVHCQEILSETPFVQDWQQETLGNLLWCVLAPDA